MKHELTLTISTFPDREKALETARALVQKRLAACVQVTSPVTSVYAWKGEIHEDGEVLLFIKTTLYNTEKVIHFVKAMHPYEVPEIISVPVIDGFDGYFEWVRETVD